MTKTLREFLVAIVAIAVCAGVVHAISDTQGNLHGYGKALVEQAGKACLFPSGGWAIVDCSNGAAASSAALNQWSRYVVQCGDDSYLATGTASSGQAADSSDGWVPAGAWLEFLTTDSLIYLSCLNKNSDSDCRLWECR